MTGGVARADLLGRLMAVQQRECGRAVRDIELGRTPRDLDPVDHTADFIAAVSSRRKQHVAGMASRCRRQSSWCGARVRIKLADNLDLVDENANVITGADRTISVWRSVPSIENVAYTAPYRLDGRLTTLQEQARSALLAHSEIESEPSASQLERIARFERSEFSSPATKQLAAALAHGQEPPDIEPKFQPDSAEAAGQALFKQACAACHGGVTGTEIADSSLHDALFPVINADGSIALQTLPDGTRIPAETHHDAQGHAQINIGIALGTQLEEAGVIPNAQGVSFPHYHVRFYADACRTQKLFDLPPPLAAAGPSGAPEAFSVDPGRSIETGDPLDWEAFDIPQLRGIATTAPYFHDNLAPDLQAVLDIYSRFILPTLPALKLPAILQVYGSCEREDRAGRMLSCSTGLK
jgi:cytochrome c peroxidase